MSCLGVVSVARGQPVAAKTASSRTRWALASPFGALVVKVGEGALFEVGFTNIFGSPEAGVGLEASKIKKKKKKKNFAVRFT